MLNILFGFFGAFLSVALVISPAQAHEKNHALTTIVVKSNGASVEIMHRFYVHDVESVVKKLLKKNIDFVSDKEAQQFFGDYLKANFSMRLKEKQPITLDYVGHEVDGRYFWIYQEITSEIDVYGLEVQHKVLTDHLPSQHNLVNLEVEGMTKSLSFAKENDWLSFSF